MLIRRAIHEELQHFIHEVMGPVTRKAVKYEKKGLKASLMHLRNLCASSDASSILWAPASHGTLTDPSPAPCYPPQVRRLVDGRGDHGRGANEVEGVQDV